MKASKTVLPIIVVSQFFCTSLWFAGNGVMDDLSASFDLGKNALGYLTSMVQFGFIFGTLLFALFSVADRYSPSKVFFLCAVLGALVNLGIVWKGNTLSSILFFRFSTGFFLAGIYPVGMKIAADYYRKGLGKSLGFLVGALVIGTAFPHLLKEIKGDLPWEMVIFMTSLLAAIGGVMMLLLVPDGPHRKPSLRLQLSAVKYIFKKRAFRSAAFGYFGHMWELYAFWAFVPTLLKMYGFQHPEANFNIPILSFLIIGIGSIACVLGGYWAQKLGVKRTASSALLLSCICCLVAPFVFSLPETLFILFLLFWGMVVIADSPLFSTLVAHNAPAELKGTALTMVNGIGFFITIISIQLVTELNTLSNSTMILILLAIGPLFGLSSLVHKSK